MRDDPVVLNLRDDAEIKDVVEVAAVGFEQLGNDEADAPDEIVEAGVLCHETGHILTGSDPDLRLIVPFRVDRQGSVMVHFALFWLRGSQTTTDIVTQAGQTKV